MRDGTSFWARVMASRRPDPSPSSIALDDVSPYDAVRVMPAGVGSDWPVGVDAVDSTQLLSCPRTARKEKSYKRALVATGLIVGCVFPLVQDPIVRSSALPACSVLVHLLSRPSSHISLLPYPRPH